MTIWLKNIFKILYKIPFNILESDLNRYVHSIEDFQYHTNNHIQNVILLGLYTFETMEQTHFRGLSRTDVIDYLALHDSAKTLSVEQLQEYGYGHDLSLSERLYSFYGKNLENVPLDKKNELAHLIQELNRIDELICNTYLKKNKYLSEDGTLTTQGEMLKLIETAADIAERSKNPVSVEEFGKNMGNPSRYLSTQEQHKLVAILLFNYSSIAKDTYSEDLENRRLITSYEKFFPTN